MIAAIKRPQRDHLERDAENEGGDERKQRAGKEAAGPSRERRREIRSHHVKRAVGEIDEIHDAEDERQARRKEEQQEPELQPVEELLDEKHGRSKPGIYFRQSGYQKSGMDAQIAAVFRSGFSS